MRYGPIATPKDLATYSEMTRLAFNMSVQDRAFWESNNVFTPDNSRGVFSDDGTLLVGMRIIDDGALYFRGDRPIPTALISSVASPPEYRRKGYIKELFLGMYAAQLDKGISLTALYPFSFPFYRKFGYELSHDAAEYTVRINQFKPWSKAGEEGTFAPANLDKDLEKFQSIYTPWAQRNLGTIARDQVWWRRKLLYHREPIPAYIYYDRDGRASGYIIYHFEEKGDWQRDLVIQDMCALDRKAQEALFGFIYNHDSQADKVVFWLPVDAQLASQFPDPREAQVRVHPGYMLRLLDVVGAFRRRAFVPEAQGSFTFTLEDQMLPANNGSYSVQVRDGRADVEKLTGSSEVAAGVQLDANALAQLYSGYTSPSHLASVGTIKISREDDLKGMQAVLSPCGQPAPYMADHF